MMQRGKVEPAILMLGALALATALIGLLALGAAWLIGRPVPVSASPAAPTLATVAEEQPDGPTDSLTDSLPVATPVPAIPVAPSVSPALPPVAPITATEIVPAPPTAAPARVAAGDDGVNVRSGPGTSYAKIGLLEPGGEALATGRSGEWWEIEYAGDRAWVASWVVTALNVDTVPVVAPPATPARETLGEVRMPEAADQITETRWIDVDLSEQKLTAIENGIPVHATLVSSGLPQTPTPTGQYRIWIKLRYDDMAGADYYIEDVPYVMYFHEGYGLHGVTWHGNFGHPMSHGCVNVPTEEAGWLFSWADVGTLVNIHA
jgi:lipoprotein-anchoring transpeptidase ErfK/SrfK